MLRVAPVVREVVSVRHQVNQARVVEWRWNLEDRKIGKVENLGKIHELSRWMLNLRQLGLVVVRLELVLRCIADVVAALCDALFTFSFGA